MSGSFNFDNSYAALPEQFYARQPPTPVSKPTLIKLNDALAEVLGLDPDDLRSEEGVKVLAGNHVPDGADPIAMAYEAMHALGVPTTRALAAVSTGDTVIREQVTPGAVLTRIASSHIRVGTFQYFVARRDLDALKLLTAHVIARHYPGLKDVANPALELLKAVSKQQAQYHFNAEFSEAYLDRFRSKLGLSSQQDTDAQLISDLLALMSEHQADFTLTFRGLCDQSGHDFIQQFTRPDEANSWLEIWRTRRAADASETDTDDKRTYELMRKANPAYIPRNHRVEEMIQAAYLQDYEPLNKLMAVLSKPYSEQSGFEHYAHAPTEDQKVKATFCGT